MGTWGPGNFDRDEAREFLDAVIKNLRKVVEDCLNAKNLQSDAFLEDCGDCKLIPALDIMITLCERYEHGINLELATAKSWKETYLRIYDDTAHFYGSSPEHTMQRRKIVESTFGKLEELAKEWDEG